MPNVLACPSLGGLAEVRHHSWKHMIEELSVNSLTTVRYLLGVFLGYGYLLGPYFHSASS